MGLNRVAVSDKVGEGESLRKPSAAERASRGVEDAVAIS